jgi:PAS domain S-box-containing protein
MTGQAEKDPVAALRESERRLRLAVEAARIGIWDWNVLTNEMVWSDEAKAIAGLPPGVPVTFDQISRMTHPDDLPRTREMAARALDPIERSTQPYEYRVIRPDGTMRWVVANGEAVFTVGEGGDRAVRYVGTLRDVTERKDAEEGLRASAVRLRIAIEAARLGVWDVDVTTGTIHSSPELNRILGFPPDAVLDPKAVQARYFPGDDAKVRLAGETAVKAGERFFEAEFGFFWPDGSIRWLMMRAEIMFAPDGKVRSVLGAILDITDRKEAEERQVFLMRELIHRVRNTLAAVRAIAASTLRSARNLKEADAALTARIGALADVHTLLSNSAGRRADLRELVAAIIEPYRTAEDRIGFTGPSIVLEERESLSLALALHELATNATKYGALSAPEGSVELAWTVSPADDGGKVLRLNWSEKGGPPVRQPRRRGFGTRLIEQALGGDPRGKVELTYAPKGFVCAIVLPLGSVSRMSEPA